jgi:hypothetical protein
LIGEVCAKFWLSVPAFSRTEIDGMPEPHFTTLDDDLPRTFRRERESRERQAQEREALGRDAPAVLRNAAAAARRSAPYPVAANTLPGESMTVTRFDVPFGHLAKFFVKAVFAALPALILLTVLLWGVGEVLQRYFPWLLKMRILIQFPG